MSRGYPNRPNGFWGNGPGNGDDSQRQREIEAYNISRLQSTVAASTFAGIALVGMFCSCLWFACCRHSSKTRKKGRTWATANVEGGLENPYNYDGYVDSQGYVQMGNEGVAPYVSNPLYPNTIYGDNGLPNAYDFNEHFGMNKEGKAALYGGGGIGGLSNALSCGTSENGNLKDVPPSYTALFFAASDAAGLKNGTASSESQPNSVADPRVANIQPIHLKVTSHSAQQQKRQQLQFQQAPGAINAKSEADHEYDDYHKKEQDQEPVSLMSVESEPGIACKETTTTMEDKKREEANNTGEQEGASAYGATNLGGPEKKVGYPAPPPYNPGYNGYMKF
ncbi:unnamed protein product [Orchesella dallaii]|uniref:Uncharacterized protein n=1 Tax=Orchesella dallaii TaxID=48710 RepID=A0ABP1S764_9HEXA